MEKRSDRFHGDASDAALAAFLHAQMDSGARILAYRTEGVPCAYLMWRLQLRPADALQHVRRQGILEHIYVLPGWRRCGFGRRLIRRFEEGLAAQECSGWITMVHAFNDASAALMRGAGAVVTVNIFEKRG